MRWRINAPVYNLRTKIQADTPAKLQKSANSKAPMLLSSIGGVGVSIILMDGIVVESRLTLEDDTRGKKIHGFRYADKEAGRKTHSSETSGGARASIYLNKSLFV
jgi:hypothetical protein